MKQRYFRRQLSYLFAALLLAIASIAPATAQAPQPAPTQPAAPAPAEPPPSQPAPARSALPADVADAVARLTSAIEVAEKTIQHLAELEEELGRLRIDVESIIGDSAQVAETLRPLLTAVRSQIEKLGPQPAKDAPPEAATIAADRARLTALASALDGAIKSTELTWVRARQLIEKITVLRHSLFTKNLMERLPSPLLPGIWRDLLSDSPGVGHRIGYLTEDWLQWAHAKRIPLVLLVVVAVLLFVGLNYSIGSITDRQRLRTEPPLPSFFERARSAAWVAPLRALPAIAAGVLLYGGQIGRAHV